MELNSDNNDIGLQENDSAGLDSVPIDEPDGDQTEWEKDEILIKLETRLNAIRSGAYAGYGKYLLPIGLSSAISGGIINYTAGLTKARDSIWIAYYVGGNTLLIIGIIMIILVLALVAFDYFRVQYIDSFDGDKLAEFDCCHFLLVAEDEKKHAKCAYFGRILDDDPLCLICPIYQTKHNNTDDPID